MFGPSTTLVVTEIFGDPLTFPLAPPAGQSCSILVKYLNIYSIEWLKILYRHSWYPEDESPRLM